MFLFFLLNRFFSRDFSSCLMRFLRQEMVAPEQIDEVLGGGTLT